jgi:hypothetical protein
MPPPRFFTALLHIFAAICCASARCYGLFCAASAKRHASARQRAKPLPASGALMRREKRAKSAALPRCAARKAALRANIRDSAGAARRAAVDDTIREDSAPLMLTRYACRERAMRVADVSEILMARPISAGAISARERHSATSARARERRSSACAARRSTITLLLMVSFAIIDIQDAQRFVAFTILTPPMPF